MVDLDLAFRWPSGHRYPFALSIESHRPALREAVRRTSGPILELGVGYGSTLPLHAVSAARAVVSVDDAPSWFSIFASFATESHRFLLVPDYAEAPIEARRWAVVFVDTSVGPRADLVRRALDHADVVIAHDTESDAYGFERIETDAHRLDVRPLSTPASTLWSRTLPVETWTVYASQAGILAELMRQHVAADPGRPDIAQFTVGA